MRPIPARAARASIACWTKLVGVGDHVRQPAGLRCGRAGHGAGPDAERLQRHRAADQRDPGDGRISFAVKSIGNNSAIFELARSRRADRPQLVIVTGAPGTDAHAHADRDPDCVADRVADRHPDRYPNAQSDADPYASEPTGQPHFRAHRRRAGPFGGADHQLRLAHLAANPRGSEHQHHLSGLPAVRRFGLSGSAQSVRLRLFVTDATNNLQSVFAIGHPGPRVASHSRMRRRSRVRHSRLLRLRPRMFTSRSSCRPRRSRPTVAMPLPSRAAGRTASSWPVARRPRTARNWSSAAAARRRRRPFRSERSAPLLIRAAP